MRRVEKPFRRVAGMAAIRPDWLPECPEGGFRFGEGLPGRREGGFGFGEGLPGHREGGFGFVEWLPGRREGGFGFVEWLPGGRERWNIKTRGGFFLTDDGGFE